MTLLSKPFIIGTVGIGFTAFTTFTSASPRLNMLAWGCLFAPYAVSKISIKCQEKFHATPQLCDAIDTLSSLGTIYLMYKSSIYFNQISKLVTGTGIINFCGMFMVQAIARRQSAYMTFSICGMGGSFIFGYMIRRILRTSTIDIICSRVLNAIRNNSSYTFTVNSRTIYGTPTNMPINEAIIEQYAPLRCTGLNNIIDSTNAKHQYTIPTNCSICIESFSTSGLSRTLPCNHSFHATCVDNWLEKHGTCPICRIHITPAKNTTPSDDELVFSINPLICSYWNRFIRDYVNEILSPIDIPYQNFEIMFDIPRQNGEINEVADELISTVPINDSEMELSDQQSTTHDEVESS